MRVFVTGATGFVGSVVVQDLIAAGHSVLGLARSEAGAKALGSAGAQVHRGSLEDAASLRSGAAAADGVIHTGFNHDFQKFAENCELDRRAISILGEALLGSERQLLVTSGLVLQVPPGRFAIESDSAHPTSATYPRASEAAALALKARGIHATAVRLPPSVHGKGDHGFVPTLIRIAREKGVSAYVGDGLNRWPAVHRLDAARVFRLALEHGVADHPHHAVAEEGVPFKDIASVIARLLNVPLVSVSAAESADHFGWFAMFAGMDAPASSKRTKALLGWTPQQFGLLQDIDQTSYFTI